MTEPKLTFRDNPSGTVSVIVEIPIFERLVTNDRAKRRTYRVSRMARYVVTRTTTLEALNAAHALVRKSFHPPSRRRVRTAKATRASIASRSA